MAINLSRNTKMFVSTVKTGNDNTNTFEIPVLDGYTFSQDVETQVITLSEASCSPVRGQKVFNTALNPVEVNFPTYIKPYKDSTNSNCVEQILWEAFVGNDTLGTNAVPGAPNMVIDFLKSDVHELLKLQIFFQMDNTTYLVEDVGVNSVELDFSIDTIAQLGWVGQGAAISEVDTSDWVAGTDYLAEPTTNKEFIKNKLSTIELYTNAKTATSGIQVANFNGTLVGGDASDLAAGTYTMDVVIDGGASQPVSITAVGADTFTTIISEINTDLTGATASIDARGDLVITSDSTGSTSTIVVTDTDLLASMKPSTYQGLNPPFDGVDAGKQYFVPITGGSMTLENNVTYLTPEELGKVNVPIPGGFTGTRAFSGTLTAYLNTGSNKSGGLLTDLLADINNSTNRFYMNIQIGGCNSTPKVEVIAPYAQLTIPTTAVEDVISTEIGFTAVGSDITQSDELSVHYYADLT